MNLIYNYNKPSSIITSNEIIKQTDTQKIINMRQSAEYHKIVRKELQKILKPGIKLIDICTFMENKIKQLVGTNNIAFPIGLSINNIIAHDTALPNDTRYLKKDDIIKIDFGVHVNGYITDSAFSFSFTDKYDKLIEATKEATWAAIKLSGPDALIKDITQIIQETIESYEIELNNKIYNIKSVWGIGGHNILPYKLHGDKLILCRQHTIDNLNQQRMSVDETYAIETFASTGEGNFNHSDVGLSHYKLNDEFLEKNYKLFNHKSTPKVFNWIRKNRKLLPFCSRWIAEDDSKIQGYSIALHELLKNNIITAYPALQDKPGTFTSQMEHTFYLHDYGKEILSHSDDY